MREILFKAKRVNSCQWIEGDYFRQNGRGIDGSSDEVLHFIYDKGGSQLIAPKTVCQYTGLQDKNGKKIFEGDLIDAWIINEGMKYHIHCLIFWDENELCYMVDVSILQDKSDTLWLNEYKSKELELTGKNIHD